jgi:secreted trypsin-like serine protease
MNKRLIAFLPILSLFLSLPLIPVLTSPVNAIYGGEIALGDERVAALVAGLSDTGAACTAALLSPQIAISAAHCINHGQISKSKDPLISPFVPTLPFWITVPGVALADDDINTRVKVVRGFAAENYPFTTENSDIVFWVLEKPLVSKYSMNVATEKEVNELIALSGQMTHIGYGMQKHRDEPNFIDGKPYKIQGTVTSIKSTTGSRAKEAKEKELTATVPARVVTAPASSNFKIWISDPRNPKVGLATGIYISEGGGEFEFKGANPDGTLYLTLSDNSWSFDVLEPDGSNTYQRRRYEMVISNNIATIENAKADSRGIYAVTSKLARVDTNSVIWQTNKLQTACPGDSGGPVYAKFNSEEKIFAVQNGPYDGGGGCDTKPWPDGHIFKSSNTLIYPYIDLLRAEPLAASIVQAYDAAVSKEQSATTTTKKTIITCIKGKVVKKVTAVKPACPSGYKKK